MRRRIIWLGLAAALAAWPQKYDGPQPPKPDLPYLKHASNLIPTEAATARKNDDSSLTIEGANSAARTPLASPIFLMKVTSLVPGQFQLFKLAGQDGRRQIAAKSPPIRIVVTKLSPDGIWKIEVDDSLDPGEYALNPAGSDRVFCFQVF